jgi:hypothetical protein
MRCARAALVFANAAAKIIKSAVVNDRPQQRISVIHSVYIFAFQIHYWANCQTFQFHFREMLFCNSASSFETSPLSRISIIDGFTFIAKSLEFINKLHVAFFECKIPKEKSCCDLIWWHSTVVCWFLYPKQKTRKLMNHLELPLLKSHYGCSQTTPQRLKGQLETFW